MKIYQTSKILLFSDLLKLTNIEPNKVKKNESMCIRLKYIYIYNVAWCQAVGTLNCGNAMSAYRPVVLAPGWVTTRDF